MGDGRALIRSSDSGMITLNLTCSITSTGLLVPVHIPQGSADIWDEK